VTLSTPPACHVCGGGISALDGDQCDTHDGEDFGLERLPLTVAVANQFTRLGAEHAFTEEPGGATYAFGHAAINPVHWPTATVLRWTVNAGWFLFDDGAGVVVYRFPYGADTEPRKVAKAVLETLAAGAPHEPVHAADDDSELEAALTGAA
jgi:hypothetical protein